MSEEYSWIWTEKMFKKIPVSYPIFSLFIACIIYLIFFFFSIKVRFFPWEFYHQLIALDLSILIAFQFAGIQYLLNNMKQNFRELKSYHRSGASANDLYIKLKHSFSSYWYYVIVAAVIIPLVILEIARILGGGTTFYIAEKTMWSFLLDIYNYFIEYLMLFLLATILWIIFNTAQTLNEIGNHSYRSLIRVDIFSIDKIGGLKSLRDFTLKVLIFYFLSITLAIISYISPFDIFSYKSFFFIILLLVGVVFFFIGLETIRKLLRGKIEAEINEINEKYEREYQRLKDIVSNENYKNKGEELNLVSTALDALHNERERILQVHNNSKGYDFMAIIGFISSFIPPLVAFLQKLFPDSTLMAFIQKLLEFGA